jgi:hypothetical protein
MSYHIKLKDYFCSSCGAQYIPYKGDIPCPNCKKAPAGNISDYASFIEQMIGSLRANKMKGGSYLPGAWYIGSFTDHIQDIIFHVFNILDDNKKEDGKSLIIKYLDSIEWDKESFYIKEHAKSIALEVYARKRELKIGFLNKILSRIDFLP